MKGEFAWLLQLPAKEELPDHLPLLLDMQKKAEDKVVRCNDCPQCADDTIKFIELGPNDKAYQRQ